VIRKLHRPEKKEFARKLRREQTDSESKLWHALRSKGLMGYKFRRQFTIGPYITDFCCPTRKLVIELDGGQHQDLEKEDAQRTRFLVSKGFHVLRFWDNEVLNELDGVLERIQMELTAPLTPTLSPVRGEGVLEKSNL
jgi:very-short-patch-repair endonuclease